MDDETPEALLTPTEVNTVTGMDAYRLGDGVKVWVRQFTAPWCRNCKIYAQELAEKLSDVDPASVLWTQSDVAASEEIQEKYAVDKLPRFDVVCENAIPETFAGFGAKVELVEAAVRAGLGQAKTHELVLDADF